MNSRDRHRRTHETMGPGVRVSRAGVLVLNTFRTPNGFDVSRISVRTGIGATFWARFLSSAKNLFVRAEGGGAMWRMSAVQTQIFIAAVVVAVSLVPTLSLSLRPEHGVMHKRSRHQIRKNNM